MPAALHQAKGLVREFRVHYKKMVEAYLIIVTLTRTAEKNLTNAKFLRRNIKPSHRMLVAMEEAWRNIQEEDNMIEAQTKKAKAKERVKRRL